MPRLSRYAPDTLPRPHDWEADAACLDADPGLFFPADHGRAAPLVEQQAKAVCALCPVVEACLRHALTWPESAGVWGGLGEGERALLRRRMQRRSRRAAARAKRREEAGAAETEETASAPAARPRAGSAPRLDGPGALVGQGRAVPLLRAAHPPA
ncbi:WhiB family transcriptional regulator [Streptomyces echinoruber]|uniref:Transcriptional regulator WhiB n=1 Tax=Streptomyces echinoruber TaxID=68898 RepID=A0A918V680_9ACTN|nr:hypothetical protein GCM10010389_07840 [Streptomyces echinoruber]